MEKSSCCSYLDIFSLLSPLIFIFDVVGDLWTIVSLYEEEKYIPMGLMVFILLASSVLLQIFSWLWYTDDPETRVECFVKEHKLLPVVHILQLGVFLRFVVYLRYGYAKLPLGNTTTTEDDNDDDDDDFYYYRVVLLCRILAVVDVSIYNSKHKTKLTLDSIDDFSMLKMFEMFTESVPQIVLMTVLIMQTPELHLFTVVKIIGSLSCMAFSMLSFHRNMREHVSKELKIGCFSSPTVLYFLWNLFLIGPRVVCVSLFASVLPCYIAAHFLSLWTLLVLWAWWQKTDYMGTKAGEWLYRATVALIWYFSWFNVAEGNTKLRGIIYHMVIGVDTMLLLGLWWWRRSVESARLGPLPINPYLLIVMLIIIYIIGVLLKLVYYWKFNPDQGLPLDKKTEKSLVFLADVHHTETCIEVINSEGMRVVTEISKPITVPEYDRSLVLPQSTGVQERRRKMVDNFYCYESRTRRIPDI
ncbi:XK-related protein 8-like [Ictalurus furcatus]|uniref:XK-related protein 8-like n=1 Tax=Ictalurus furcatus TaxID=66913 RepID=UPI002350EE43|nr:XK-related protein 8-like [Ictalurus furcatus]